MQPGLKHKATENITKHGSLPFPHRSSSPIQFSKTGGTFISTKVSFVLINLYKYRPSERKPSVVVFTN